MPTWDSLSSNQLVDRDALNNGVSEGWLVYYSGQSTSGLQCVDVSSSETYVQIDTSYMPTDGTMPIKADFYGGQTTVNVYNTQQTSPTFIPCLTFFGANGINLDTIAGNSSVTHYFPGGNTGINVVVNTGGGGDGSGINPSLRVQVYENGVLIYDQAQATSAGNLFWGKDHILPFSTYNIYCFSQSYTYGSFVIYNNSSYDVYFGYDDGVILGTIYSGSSTDVYYYLTSGVYSNFELDSTLGYIGPTFEVDGSTGQVIAVTQYSPILSWSLPDDWYAILDSGNTSMNIYDF